MTHYYSWQSLLGLWTLFYHHLQQAPWGTSDASARIMEIPIPAPNTLSLQWLWLNSETLKMLVQKSWELGLFADISLNKDIRCTSRVQLQAGICGSKWSRNFRMLGDKAMPPHHLWTYSDELCPLLVRIIFTFSHPHCNNSMVSASSQGVSVSGEWSPGQKKKG